MPSPLPSPVPGLRFVLSDGSLDRPKMAVVARTRAVIHAACYASDERAYQGELELIESEAQGELQIWAIRNGSGLITITGHAARELATDLPLCVGAA